MLYKGLCRGLFYMRNFPLIILLFLFSAISSAADLYTSIKSSLYESISDGINVQLIDANIPYNFTLVKITADTDLVDAFNTLKLELMATGYKVNYFYNKTDHTLIIKHPRESIEGTLELLIQSLEAQQIYGFELVLLGSINQQRLLGAFNRLVKSSEFRLVQKPYDKNWSRYDISLMPLDLEQDRVFEFDWKLALATGLLNCNYVKDGYVAFSYNQQTLACSDYLPKSSLTDKDVANLKDKLFSDIQLSIQSPVGFLLYIASFNTERRLELSQTFFTQIPNLSIDTILSYHYKRLLNVDHEAEFVVDTNVDRNTSYRPPENFKIKSELQPSQSSIVNFNIVINNLQTCVQLNCQSLANLPYITYTKTDHTHFFAMRYPASHETSVIDELNKVLFIPLSTASDIGQEDLYISLNGGYLLEAYDESFQLVSRLSLVEPNIMKGGRLDSAKAKISFYLNKNNQSTIQLEVDTVPGAELWEESELLYFILLNEMLKAEQNITMSKANTLIYLSSPELVSLETVSSTIEFNYRSTNPMTVENFIKSFSQKYTRIKYKLSRDQFVSHKKALLVHLGLQEASHNSVRQISQMFDLESPVQLLSQRLETLSYEQFDSFLDNSLAYNHISISTNHELESAFKQAIIEQLDQPNPTKH